MMLNINRSDLGVPHMQYDADNCSTVFAFGVTQEIADATITYVRDTIRRDFIPHAVCCGDYEDGCFAWCRPWREDFSVSIIWEDGGWLLRIHVDCRPQGDDRWDYMHEDYYKLNPHAWTVAAHALRTVFAAPKQETKQ